MPVLGKLALAVVAGGVALGTMLGAAANPVMKMPAGQPWQGALQAPIAADPGYLMIEAPPEDLSPYRDSYAPTWAREELADWEPDYPAWTYSDLAGEVYVDAPLANEPRLEEQPVMTAAEAPPALDAAPEPVVPADVAPQPAGPASHPRLAAHLDDVY
jgi:hypothetical protein